MNNQFQHAELAKRYGGPLRNIARPSESDRSRIHSARLSPASNLAQNVGDSPSAGLESARKPDLGLKPRRQSHVTREEFELASIREFSHSGHHVGASVSRAERHERIRAAILRESKMHDRWHDSDFTYAEVYAQAYQQKLAVDNSDDKHASAAWRASLDENSFDDDEAFDEGAVTQV